MLITDKLAGRYVALRKNQMPHNPKTSIAEYAYEAVGLQPPVETHAKAVSLQNTVHFGKSRFQPSGIIIVRHSAASRDLYRVI
jgi:hypothetical protein